MIEILPVVGGAAVSAPAYYNETVAAYLAANPELFLYTQGDQQITLAIYLTVGVLIGIIFYPEWLVKKIKAFFKGLMGKR